MISCNHKKTSVNNYSGYNNCIVVDYSLPSSIKRMFIKIDGIIIDSMLVCSGRTDNQNKPIFSNVPNSYCSSLGKVEIMYPYVGTFGKAYKLKGLEATNNNIFIRNIVLHAHSCVPERTTYRICNSEGCFTVNPDAFTRLDNYIQSYDIKHIYAINGL